MTSGLVGAKLQSSFARPVWPKTEFQRRKALMRCRQLGLTSFQEVDLFKTDVTKRCGKFQTKMDIQASRKLQPSAQWKPKLSPSWAMLKRPFISQGRKELLTPSLTHHLRGHSASLHVEIPVFCLRASLRWLKHLRVLLTRTVFWPPPFLPHEGGFIAWLSWQTAMALGVWLSLAQKKPNA